ARRGVIAGRAGGRRGAYGVAGRGAPRSLAAASVPSLLSLPYLACVDDDGAVYLATRAAVLSRHNPYYFAGLFLEGVGSPHTPKDHVWPIAKSVEGLTSRDPAEKLRILR